MLMVGQKAPEFSGEAVVGKGDFTRVSLGDYRGKWVVFFFYPQDFTEICPTELAAFSGKEGEFKRLNAVVLACSVDSKHVHKAFLQATLGELTFPLLSDPTHAISESYRAYLPEKGYATRATFIIDPEGIVQYALYQPERVGRSVNETLRVLDALTTGEGSPADWKRGDPTLPGQV